MKYSKLIISSITLFVAILSLSCSNDTNVIPVKNWKILYEQDQTIESVLRKSGWEPVEIPLTFKLPYSPQKDFQYVWLKGEFDIKDDPSIYYGLSTGRVRLADKVFINRNYIGSLPPERVNWHAAPRNYVIPEGTLKKGKNTIYIQLGVYDAHGMYNGGISGGIIIQAEKDFYQTEFFNNLIYDQLPFGIGISVTVIIILSLILYRWNRKEKLFLYFAGILLYNIIFSFMSLPSYRFVQFELFHAITMSMPMIAWIFLILSIQSIYRKYLSNFNRVIIPLLLLAVLFNFIFYDTSYFPLIIGIPKYLYFIMVIPYFIFIIYRLNSINHIGSKKPDKYLISTITTGLIMVGLVPIFDSYIYFAGGAHSGFPTIFVPPVALILFAIFIARESMKRQLEIELLYNKLERFEARNRELSITGTSEEKLERVIDFIKENFTLDISREGLASAVDLNPDYMSRLFKAYTGMKVNEYINKLRIEEAAARLRNEKTRIIDIAFAVGFENTITFNRTFKSIMKVTPSEYRTGIDNE